MTDAVIQQDLQEDINLLIAFINDKNSNDRTVAIVCASYLEDYLGRLITANLPGINSNLKKKLFDPVGLLGPMSAKIDLAKALNLIDHGFFANLKIIASIRNQFAHNLRIHSFSHPEITKRVDALEPHFGPGVELKWGASDFSKFKDATNTKAVFTMCATLICIFLLNAAIARDNQKPQT